MNRSILITLVLSSLAIVHLGLGLLTLFRSKEVIINRFFLGITMSLSIWTYCHLRALNAETEIGALFWTRTIMIGPTFLPWLFWSFSIALTRQLKWRKILWPHCAIPAALLAVIGSPLMISSVQLVDWGVKFKTGPAFLVYTAYYLGYMTAGLAVLFRAFKNPGNQSKGQFFIIFWSALFSVGFGMLASIVFPIFGLNQLNRFGPVGTLSISAGFTYAIIKHRFLDIGLLARWGTAYAIVVASSTLGFVAVAALLNFASDHLFHVPFQFVILFSLCAATLLFPLMNSWARKFTDRVLFRSSDLTVKLGELEYDLDKSESLVDFSDKLSKWLMEAFEADHAGLAILDWASSFYLPLPLAAFSSLPISNIGRPISKSDFLIRTLENERRLFKYGIVLEDELTQIGNRALAGERTTFWKIRRTMRWFGASVTVPVVQEKSLIAFLVLGKKINRSIYSEEDKKLLSHLGSTVGSRIMRMLSVHDLGSGVSFLSESGIQ